MASLIIDPRDQKFVLYEMLNVEELCKAPLYADFSRDMFDMALNEAEKFATTAIFPCPRRGGPGGVPPGGRERLCPQMLPPLRADLPRGGLGDDERRCRRGRPGFPPRRHRGGQGVVHPQPRLPHLLHPDRRGRPPDRGLRDGGAEKEIPAEDARGRLGRDDGPDRAGGRNRRRKPQDEGDPPARRDVPPPGDEEVHHRGGQRPHGEHHPAGPRPDRGGPSGDGRDLDLPRPQVSRQRRRDAGQAERLSRSARSRRRWGSTARPPA